MSTLPYRICALLLLALTAAPRLCLARDTSDLAVPQLVLERGSAAPGERVYAGIHFKMKSPWHIYWKNPGEAGVATRVEISGPPDLSIGELEFPTPVQFTQPGNLAGYGYLDEALFRVPLTIPANAQPGSVIELKASIRWLACDDICVPGRAQQSATLRVAQPGESRAGSTPVFEAWKTRFPLHLEDAAEVLTVTQSGKLSDEQVQLQIEWKAPAPERIEWFPATPKQLKLEALQVDSRNVNFRLLPLQGTGEIPPQFDSLIVFTAADGSRTGITIPVSVR